MTDYKFVRKVGSVSQIFQIFITASNATTFNGLTGLAYNTSSLVSYRHKDSDTTATAISLVDMTIGTYTSGGFKEIDATNMPGWYQFCPPNNCFSFANSICFSLQGAANMRQVTIEVDLTPTPADLIQIDGAFNSSATLNLTKLNIVNPGGTAFVAQSTGGNGHGIQASGNGTGNGLVGFGGATGSGLVGQGGGSSGTGILGYAIAGDSSGIGGAGFGNGSGLYVNGGTTGHGIFGYGGVTSGAGAVFSAQTSGAGLNCFGAGSASAGLLAQGGGNGAGFYALGGGSGSGILAQSALTGHGINGIGGATSGSGLYVDAVGGGSGITAIGVGAASIYAAQGISGPLDASVYTSIADALFKRDMSAVTGEASRSLLNCMRFIRNKWSFSGLTGTVTKEDDTTAAWTFVVTTSPAAEPVTSFTGG